jgi:RNA polymerase sigma factor (sigma-70 family)
VGSSVLANMAAHFFPTSRDPVSALHVGPSGAREAEQSGARAAEIAQLFRDHNRALVMFLTSRLKDMQAAREVAQEAYVRVLQLESPGAISFLRSYLFKVAANLAIDRLRSQQFRARLDPVESLENFLDEATPERTAIAREELALLASVIAELPMKYQEAFYRHRVDDESFEDIARRMGLKDRMVRRYVTYTLIYLRLRREGFDAGEAWRRVHS